jgi:hypothetical protein
MQELLDWFDRHADPKDGLLVTHCYGDWMGFNPESHNSGSSHLTPPESVTAFYHVLAMQYMSEVAGAIGKDGESAALAARHKKAQAAYHARFYDAKAGGYSPCMMQFPSPQCPPGHELDVVEMKGDNGSCDCNRFCASDWGGQLHRTRGAWKGAVCHSAYDDSGAAVPCNSTGIPATCRCVQATFYCPKKGGCENSCGTKGLPVAAANCIQSLCHGTSAAGSQTSNAMALALGAPPDEATAKAVAAKLAADVLTFENKTTTGVVGIAWLFPMLDQYGYSEAALDVLLNDAYPSIGHMAHQNMTTLCENWACTFHDAGGGSQNHIMLGAFDAWLLSSVGGLDSNVNATDGGWRNVIARVSPGAVTRVRRAAYRKQTRFGEVTIDWNYTGAGEGLVVTLTVPVGMTVALHTPTKLRADPDQESDDGYVRLHTLLETRGEGPSPTVLWTAAAAVSNEAAAAAAAAAAVNAISVIDGAVTASVGSGSYRFAAKYV